MNSPDTLEDLAELDHIFSDKTGTLNKNKLNFKEISIINGNDQIQYVIQDEVSNTSLVDEGSIHRHHGTSFKVLPASN
jgi:P-type E1-E2 ATPase